jgi:hypothetical protein
MDVNDDVELIVELIECALKYSSANPPRLNAAATAPMDTKTATYPYSAHRSHPRSTPKASEVGSTLNQSPAASMSFL